MYIHLSHIKHQLNLRKQNPKYDNQIGSILKDQRKKYNYTLEEGAEGICSISYLSKVENNMILPSDNYLFLFNKKYNLNLKVTQTEETINDFTQIIDDLLNLKKSPLNINIEKHTDYKSKLVQLLYQINNEKYEESYFLYNDLLSYIKNLDKNELALFLFSIAMLLKYEGRMKDSFTILNLIQLNDLEFKIKLMIENEKILLATKLNLHAYLILNYDKFLHTLVQYEYYLLAQNLKFSYLNYMIQYIKFEELDIYLHKSNNMSTTQKKYLLSRFYYLNNEYKKAFEIIKGFEHKASSIFMLAIQIANKLKLKTYILEMIKKDSLKFNKNEKLSLKYLDLKYMSDKAQQTDFIRENILKINDFPDLIDQLNFWYEEGMENLKEMNYYKEAANLSQQIFRKIRQLSTYID